MGELGPKAYCTAGWLGLSDEAILATVRKLQEEGFDAFKVKVGLNSSEDVARLKFMREAIGSDQSLMVDANQFWGVGEAKEHVVELRAVWLEVGGGTHRAG